MSDDKKTPELRFGGFSDEWVQQALIDILSTVSNNTLSRAALNYENGEVKNIHYGDILIKFGSFVDASNNDIPFITNGSVADYKSLLLKDGDIIFADTAEDETVGKVVEITNSQDINVVSGLHTMAYRPKNKFSTYFLGYYLNSNAYHHRLLPLMQGIKVLSLSRSNLSKTLLHYPASLDEQTAIGNFFRTLDDTIALKKQQHEKTQNIKKAMLEKMFPKKGENVPEIRFDGFTGAWSQRRIVDVAKIFIGLVTTMTSNYRSEGILLIRNSDIKEGYFKFDDDPIHLDVNFAEDNASRKLQLNDIVTVHTGDVGTSAVIGERENGSIGFATINTRPDSEIIDSNFLATFFNTVRHKNWAIQMSTGDGRNNYNLYDFNKLYVPVPNKNEQTAIGNFFRSLDTLIEAQRQEIEKLQNIKNTLLNKMFV